jgi:hypothetical protein
MPGGQINLMKYERKLLSLAVAMCGCGIAQIAAHGQTLQGGVNQREYSQPNQMQGGTSYPAPQLLQQAPVQGNAFSNAPLQSSAQERAPIQLGASRSVTLPANFMGAWLVKGQRTKVEAQPEFQAGAEQAFAVNTSNVWNISGNPQAGYTLGSDSGIQTQLWVDKVQGSTAFIRYQHPIKNTMAQEAVVMNLQDGGARFEGLERISIIKEGQKPPRAKVQYNLFGQRKP